MARPAPPGPGLEPWVEQDRMSEVLSDSTEHQGDSGSDFGDLCIATPLSRSMVQASHVAAAPTRSTSHSDATLCTKKIPARKRQLVEVEFVPIDRGVFCKNFQSRSPHERRNRLRS